MTEISILFWKNPAGRRLVLISGLIAVLALFALVDGSMVRACARNPGSMKVMERVFDFHLGDSALAGDAQTIWVQADDNVRLRWTTDQTVVLRLEGYELEREVAPGGVAEIAFKANITGRFPIVVKTPAAMHGQLRQQDPLAVVLVLPR